MHRVSNKKTSQTDLSVKEYLDVLNRGLEAARGRIVGEVCNVKLYEGRSYLYFSLKDTDSAAVLNCFMWKRDYALCGVELEDGLEIVIEGYPKVYVPNGSLSFQTESAELVGEGALKKAYDKLKLKLESEGLLESGRKRPIPDYPRTIGVITSRDGAVLSDFTSNIGKFGYRIRFVNSRVEGQAAVKDLMSAVKTLRRSDIDVLVIMRGGGSLESFTAFNNELLVREIAKFPVPVIAGIGHDKDVCLVALAADSMVSTPTAVAQQLNATWEQALLKVHILERSLVGAFERRLSERKFFLVRSSSLIKESFAGIFERFRNMRASFRLGIKKMDRLLHSIEHGLLLEWREISRLFQKSSTALQHSLGLAEKELGLLDPERQLSRGFSIVRHGGRIIKSVQGLRIGDTLELKTHDGETETKVSRIIAN